MDTYKVTVIETKIDDFYVEANSEHEARDLADGYSFVDTDDGFSRRIIEVLPGDEVAQCINEPYFTLTADRKWIVK